MSNVKDRNWEINIDISGIRLWDDAAEEVGRGHARDEEWEAVRRGRMQNYRDHHRGEGTKLKPGTITRVVTEGECCPGDLLTALSDADLQRALEGGEA